MTECGTIPTQAQIDYLNKTRAQRSVFSYDYKSSNAIQIPIINHIVKRSDGSGGLTLEELATAIQDLSIGSANDIPDVLNIYYFESITMETPFGNFQVNGYASPPPGPDRVMMKNSYATNGTTLKHEIGHYFSLYHTHGKDYNITDELVNGTNCETAGDDICDTPADPNLLSSVYNCQYIGTATDANGQPYNPQVNNIMSYSGSCRNALTPKQFDRVLYSVLNDRNNLICNPTCTATQYRTFQR